MCVRKPIKPVSMVCPLCGLKRITCVSWLGSHKIWQCLDCSIIFLWPFPLEGDFSRLYTGSFHLNPGDENSIHEKVQSFRQILAIIRTIRPEGKLLDVGCSTGIFLHLAEHEGYEVYGIDVGREAVETAQSHYGLKRVKQGTLDNLKEGEECFDIITMLDLIEHLPDPLAALSRALRLLKKDGYLVLLTPDAGGSSPVITRFFLVKLFGLWDHPEPPYHLYQFSQNVLTYYLDKAGFEVVRSMYHEIPLNYAANRFFLTLVEILRIFKKTFIGAKGGGEIKNGSTHVTQPVYRSRGYRMIIHRWLYLLAWSFIRFTYSVARLFRHGNTSFIICRPKTGFPP